MTNTLKIHTSLERQFIPLDVFTGTDMLHPEPLFQTTVLTRFGEGNTQVRAIMDAVNRRETPVLEYYNPHGQQTEAPIVFSQEACSTEIPFPHDEINVVFSLSEKQIRELQPPTISGEFGY